jgi:hypothetical protein
MNFLRNTFIGRPEGVRWEQLVQIHSRSPVTFEQLKELFSAQNQINVTNVGNSLLQLGIPFFCSLLMESYGVLNLSPTAKAGATLFLGADFLYFIFVKYIEPGMLTPGAAQIIIEKLDEALGEPT